ncbi:MAG TPA: alpha-L-arabinofuranosidase C-terminal domain-containing protein [Bryobacteraceae bacterium]|nr:alpha-L-arabinofuranosidase C-terminal domain-containing protein [Bryobacteraceae bacterium]
MLDEDFAGYLRGFGPWALGILLTAAPGILLGQTTPVLHIQADQVTAHVSPSLYGLMTEEINYSYDGGLYGELVRNRNFKEDAREPVHWTLVRERGAIASMSLDPGQPFNSAVPTSLKLSVTQVTGAQSVGIANDGFWGIPVRPNTRYRATFYAKTDGGLSVPITVAIVSNDGATTYASALVSGVSGNWQRYEATLTTKDVKASADNHFVLSTNKPGTIWFGFVSLFPPTWNDRPNGNRKDIMQLLADMKPSFLRFPGGNYLEGRSLETRFVWKNTVGPITQRPGHYDDSWRYWSSDGMGLLEFLEWCEDLHMQPVLALYAGFGLRGTVRIKPGPELQPYVQDALDEIEYVTGSASTTWGAQRAREGHPEAFPLHYVEVGNEDSFDREPGSYDGRFTQFFDAIKTRYPQLQVIATAPVKGVTPDVIDEHYYRNSEDEMASHAHDYDTRPRTGPKVFVGEWATRVGVPTPNMSAALGDASWMTGMERNSDLVIMSSYAPLFVNVNPGGMQWRTDLIGYNTLNSYGSPAYYAQKMFSQHHGDDVLKVDAQSVPTREWQPPARRGAPGSTQPAARPAPEQVPTLFCDATRDSKNGAIYLKVVNRAGTPQPVKVELSGLAGIDASGQAITLSANSPEDTNSITEPEKVVPVSATVSGLGTNFTHTFAPYSVNVLILNGK